MDPWISNTSLMFFQFSKKDMKILLISKWSQFSTALSTESFPLVFLLVNDKNAHVFFYKKKKNWMLRRGTPSLCYLVGVFWSYIEIWSFGCMKEICSSHNFQHLSSSWTSVTKMPFLTDKKADCIVVSVWFDFFFISCNFKWAMEW